MLLRLERGVVRTQTWSEEGSKICLGYWGLGDVVGSAVSRIQLYEIECSKTVEMSILLSGFFLLIALVRQTILCTPLAAFQKHHDLF